VAGPNAGHSVVDATGKKWALRQVPVAAVTNKGAKLVIAAGSEIDPDVLDQEIMQLDAAGFAVGKRLLIDGSATVVTDDHKYREGDAGLTERIGSTGKGIGAARASRIMREAVIWEELSDSYLVTDTARYLQAQAAEGDHILIEGTQGFGLGLHGEHYPQTTSSDCRAIDFLAMAGLSPWAPGITDFQVWVVARAFPIRVAGNSGHLFAETTWEQLGLPSELTTVTQKVRRVGHWDQSLIQQAIWANGGPAQFVRLAYTMADQRFSRLAGLNGAIGTKEFEESIQNKVRLLEPASASAYLAGTNADLKELFEWLGVVSELTRTPVAYIGTGPGTAIWRV
jgi:adenylosuccinate synthase